MSFMADSSLNKSEVASLDKALRVIECMSHNSEDIALATLAKQAGLPKSTLVRLLNTLKAHSIVWQDENTKRYKLGWALIYLGRCAASSFNLVDMIRPYLTQLSKETGETASLVMRRNDRAVYVDRVSSSNMIRSAPKVGDELPFYASGSGKVLLSALPEAELCKILDQIEMIRFTDKTITDPVTFREELAAIRKKGWAFDDEEGERGCRCIAAPLRDWNAQVVASISITGPTMRIGDGDINRLSEKVCSIVEAASKALQIHG